MQQDSDKSDFSIVLKSGRVEDSSEYWQEQCQQLYDSIRRNLPEDSSIEPLNREGSKGDRIVLETIFSTLAACGITGKVFVDIFTEAMKMWLEFRPTAEIELKCPDGITVKISKMPLAKLSNFFEKNPQLSVCKGLHQFKNSNE
jgi:hypothetical protein